MIKLLSIGSLAVFSTLLAATPVSNVEPQETQNTTPSVESVSDPKLEEIDTLTLEYDFDESGQEVYKVNGEEVDVDEYNAQTAMVDDSNSDVASITATGTGDEGEELFEVNCT